MKLRWLAIFLGIAISSAPTHAQVGVYGKFDSVRLTATSVGSSTQATTWFEGPGVGVYYDFLQLGPIAIGADLRGDLGWGSQQRYRSALFGLRLVVKPPLLPIRPYIQGSVGAGGSRYDTAPISGDTSYTYSTKFQYQVAAGLDYTLLPHLDLRAAEFEYGRMSGISSGVTAPVATIFTLSAGLVVRFP
jgi:hypothetical protein